MKKIVVTTVFGSMLLACAGFSAAAVSVDVRTPNATVHVGTPQPAPQAVVIERERVIVKEKYKDNGKHKGHKKNKKHKKDRD